MTTQQAVQIANALPNATAQQIKEAAFVLRSAPNSTEAWSDEYHALKVIEGAGR